MVIFFDRCKCEQCSAERFVGAREFRCCWDVANIIAKLTFDGTTESIKCIAQKENFEAMTNKAVLVNVGPLLKDKDGNRYHLCAGTPENEEVQHCSCQLYICEYHSPPPPPPTHTHTHSHSHHELMRHFKEKFPPFLGDLPSLSQDFILLSVKKNSVFAIVT